MGLIDALARTATRIAKRFRTAFRNSDTGRFISRAEYDALPEEDRSQVRFRVD